MHYTSEREHAVEIVHELIRWSVLQPGGGAVSMRLDDGNILMSSTTLSFRWWNITTADFVVLDPHGNVVEKTGPLGASGTPMHLALYEAFPACHGIAHAHPPYALAFASLGETIPSVTNQLDTLGEIPCVAADDRAIKRRVADGFTAMPMIPGVAQSPGPYAVNMELIPQVLAHLAPRADELDRHGLGFTIYRHGAMTIGRTLHEAANNLHRIESGAHAALLQATLLGGLSHVRTNPLFTPDHAPEDARASA
ncbi:class II aldolase/adducin family protein [Embleya sp. AB8]|uniref:class II aldolase/adducin family protein n=1 Tax=Embleya sp. AB8 TaxID=3156304 RepID=UPI003C733F5A